MKKPEMVELMELWSRNGAKLCRELCANDPDFCHPSYSAEIEVDAEDPDAVRVHQLLRCRRGCPMLSPFIIDYVTPEIEERVWSEVSSRNIVLDITMGSSTTVAVDNN